MRVPYVVLFTFVTACQLSSNSKRVDQSQVRSYAKDHFELNLADISFLLPIANQYLKIPITENGKGGPLITSEQYDALGSFITEAESGTHTVPGGFGGPPSITVIREYGYQKFHITAFRFDACPETVPDSLDASECSNPLIRLVAQNVFEDKAQTADEAIHLIYRFEKDQLVEIINDLIQLQKIATSLTGASTKSMPIGIHPALQSLDTRDNQASRTPAEIQKAILFGEKVKALILQHCGQETLFAAASMRGGFNGRLGSGGSQLQTWEFRSTVFVGPTPIARPITGVAQPATEPFLSQIFAIDANGLNDFVSPEPNNAQGMKDYIAMQVAGEDRMPHGFVENEVIEIKELALLTAAKFENPKMTKVLEGDCVSCHVSTRMLLRGMDSSRPFAISDDARQRIIDHQFTTEPEQNLELILEAKEVKAKLALNVINFGYRGSDMGISQRTINETAYLLPLINRVIKTDPSIVK